LKLFFLCENENVMHARRLSAQIVMSYLSPLNQRRARLCIAAVHHLLRVVSFVRSLCSCMHHCPRSGAHRFIHVALHLLSTQRRTPLYSRRLAFVVHAAAHTALFTSPCICCPRSGAHRFLDRHSHFSSGAHRFLYVVAWTCVAPVSLYERAASAVFCRRVVSVGN
jgi:hypothetical protein